MTKKSGFTIIEFLIVIAMIGILAGIGIPNYLTWRANTITREAAQQFARDVDRLRTEAKRENTMKTISVAEGGGTTYNWIDGDETGTVERTISLPAGTTITPQGTTTSFTFRPPYGTIVAVPSRFDYVIQWQSDPSIRRTVRVLAIMGKVIVQ